jgi:hypothetical protein
MGPGNEFPGGSRAEPWPCFNGSPITDYCPVAELKNPDRVFLALELLNPSDAEFEKAVGRIYDARSKNLHVGYPFPPGIAIGVSPRIRARDLPLNPIGHPDIPPAPWFERVVSIAARKFLMPADVAPFVEYCPDSQRSPQALHAGYAG